MLRRLPSRGSRGSRGNHSSDSDRSDNEDSKQRQANVGLKRLHSKRENRNGETHPPSDRSSSAGREDDPYPEAKRIKQTTQGDDTTGVSGVDAGSYSKREDDESVVVSPVRKKQLVGKRGVGITGGLYTAQEQAAATASFLQSTRRLLPERPLHKMSVSLLDTYKNISTAYDEDRARAKENKASANQHQAQGAGGVNNNGWDDENFNYIVTAGEMFDNRYKIIERVGKGTFGVVVQAEDTVTQREVAIKIIKSKKPFLMQAQTEIEILTHLSEKDPDDQHNIVRLLRLFMYRNHQCLVFEMLSLNLYELLKNTQFGGVSLDLVRKFGKQVLKSLAFLAKSDVDIIHTDLKPENILLCHPKKSGIKVIDFGSSCRSNERTYSYIQSRFYRAPEVMLGLPYSCAIDMWSLGCILAEMHTGQPLFDGSDQFDLMQKVVKLLGMVPTDMLELSAGSVKLQFFEKKKTASGHEWQLRQSKPSTSTLTGKPEAESATSETTGNIVPSTDPMASLKSVVVAGKRQNKKVPISAMYNSAGNYDLFLDLLYKMLAYRPEERITPQEALSHPFMRNATSGQALSRGKSGVYSPGGVAMTLTFQHDKKELQRFNRAMRHSNLDPLRKNYLCMNPGPSDMFTCLALRANKTVSAMRRRVAEVMYNHFDELCDLRHCRRTRTRKSLEEIDNDLANGRWFKGKCQLMIAAVVLGVRIGLYGKSADDTPLMFLPTIDEPWADVVRNQGHYGSCTRTIRLWYRPLPASGASPVARINLIVGVDIYARGGTRAGEGSGDTGSD